MPLRCPPRHHLENHRENRRAIRVTKKTLATFGRILTIMLVAAPGLKPVGIQTDAVQPQQLQLQIPQLPVDKTKPQEQPRREERRSEGWQRQESAVQSQADLHHDRSAQWRRFQGSADRRSNFGAVVMDGRARPKSFAPTSETPPPSGRGWPQIDHVQRLAAQFEEKNRPNLGQLGGESSVDMDPNGPSPRSQRSSNNK